MSPEPFLEKKILCDIIEGISIFLPAWKLAVPNGLLIWSRLFSRCEALNNHYL